MNKTQLFLLLAVLGLSSFYAWSKLHKLEAEEKEYQEARYYPEIEEKDVELMRVASEEPKFEYTLTRRGDQWYIDSHLLNIEKSHQLVNSILELSREREMDPSPTAEREAEFQLDKPAYILSVVKNGGEELGAVKLGKRTPDFNHFYGQWVKGGAVNTVPAFTLGVLEEKPEDLREDSLFPVEVAAVDLFSIGDGGEDRVVLKSDGEDKYAFVSPKLGAVDETRVKDFMTQLKDLKVGRFLSDDENPPAGQATVQYRADVSYSDLEIVTELQQRVPANPKLVYGRRFLRKKDGTEPLDNTLERFVVEITPDGQVAKPVATLFVDRRVVVLDDLNEVKSLEVELNDKSLRATRNKQGKWSADAGQLTDSVLSNFLFTLKDLRFEEATDQFSDPKAPKLAIRVEGKSDLDVSLRFGMTEKGKPYLWRDSQGYSLSESSWKAITESAQKVINEQPTAK